MDAKTWKDMIQNVKRGYVTDRALGIPWDKAVAELNSFAAMCGLAKDLFPTADGCSTIRLRWRTSCATIAGATFRPVRHGLGTGDWLMVSVVAALFTLTRRAFATLMESSFTRGGA